MSGIDIDAVHRRQANNATVAELKAALGVDPTEPPPDGRRRHTDAEQAAAVDELSPLTPKQREVLVLYCKGYGVKETASLLDMGISTVNAHRTAVVAALGMTMIEAAVLAVRARWV